MRQLSQGYATALLSSWNLSPHPTLFLIGTRGPPQGQVSEGLRSL